MPQPRIALFTSEYAPRRGGIGTYAHEVAQAARDLGCEVVVYAPDYGTERDLPDGSVRRFPGGDHSYRDTLRKRRLVLDVLGRERFDIVHAADWPFFLPVARAAAAGARKIVTLHGTEVNQMAGRGRSMVIRALGLFDRVDGFICNSAFTRRLLVDKFPQAAPKAVACPLGVSRFWLEPQGSREGLRSAFEFGPDDLVVVTTGRLTPRKGHLFLHESLSTLPDAVRGRVRWRVVGPRLDADYVKALEAVVARGPVATEILGEITAERMRSLYGAADLFCLTGEQTGQKVEGFGLVFLEAGGCGLPSVATLTGGVADAVEDGVSGLLADRAGISAALQRVLADADFRKRLAEGAVRQARHLSWQRCAAQTYGLSADFSPRTAGAVSQA